MEARRLKVALNTFVDRIARCFGARSLFAHKGSRAHHARRWFMQRRAIFPVAPFLPGFLLDSRLMGGERQ
jgi:hypothetical protein